jgi:short-subunit dehydrogenase
LLAAVRLTRVPIPSPSSDDLAVVTGASHGIGEALATELAARGYHLIITARREELLNALAARLTDSYGVTVEVRAADLADPTQRAKLADELTRRKIAILCANAGVATVGPVAKLDPAGERALVQLNVVAVHDLVLAVLPGMIERRAGGILISGSAAGNSPIPNNAAYSSSKAFLNTFSEALRLELRPSGVHVTLLAPGPVSTGIADFVDSSAVAKLVPDYLWVSPELTAKASLDGLSRNKMRVVPGLPGKVMSLASQYLPRAIVAPIVGNAYRKMGGG